MGDPRKQHKKYRKPKKAFEINRIKEENAVMKKYGLKNKKEVWRAEFFITGLRNEAKQLIKNPAKQEEFLSRVKNMGFSVKNIDDVLSLKREDLLERRLQTILLKKNLVKSAREARQKIVHKHVTVAGKV